MLLTLDKIKRFGKKTDGLATKEREPFEKEKKEDCDFSSVHLAPVYYWRSWIAR